MKREKETEIKKEKRTKEYIIQFFAMGAVYFLFLYLFSYFPVAVPAAEFRLSFFIPVAGGILFGWPAALATAIADYIFYILNYGGMPYEAIFVSVINGLLSIGSYYLYSFLSGQKKRRAVSDVKSTGCFLMTMLPAAALESLLHALFVPVPEDSIFSEFYLPTFAVRAQACIIFGLPCMMYIPVLLDRIRNRGSEKNVLRTDLLSLKSKTFRLIVTTGIFISLGITVAAVALFHCVRDEFSDDVIIRFYYFNGIMLLLMVLLTVYEVAVIERRITSPFYRLSLLLNPDGSGEKNELEVLSERIDFIACGKREIDGNTYDIYVGLTSKDGKTQYDRDFALDLIGRICVEICGGYFTHSEGEGGYMGENSVETVKESTLVFTIFGAVDEQIETISDRICKELCQESVLINKNNLKKWYYRPQCPEELN